ncbi:ankyrin repeat-containing protein, putative [Eimeria maxima]|uniref:Ankyrin repeat-containing protein, putative n=1 Tax=Eimeria maxima TaxID=5804 RepID=U6M273_EIMMA|nr:ankyrin repeat-containing protein, putative [Eimeria maxima]CDJ57168.1 ankyrin repeat-containing protein, putative [Eimeria maxima]
MTEALVKAVQKGDEDTVRRLLTEGADPSALNKKGLSALHVAAREGDSFVLTAILESPAIFINSPDRDNGFTALLHAISGCQGDPATVRQTLGQTDVVALLLGRGVPREAVNAYGDTPLHLALKEGNEDTALMLLQRGADPNTKDAGGSTPLHLAIGNRLLTAALAILGNKKFTIKECEDANGNTPFHVAAEEGLNNIIKQLEEAGFSSQTPNNAGGQQQDQQQQPRRSSICCSWYNRSSSKPISSKTCFLCLGITPAAIIEQRKQQMEERGERKRQQAAAAMQQTEVTAFCTVAGLPATVHEMFFRKKFFYVDEAFLTLTEGELRKIGLNAAERVAFSEAVEKHKQEAIRQQELEAEEIRLAAASQTRRLRIVGCVIVLVTFALLYIGLQLVVLRQQR